MSSRSAGKGRPRLPAVTRPEVVHVVVAVNHDQLRKGESGEVELTDDVRARLDRGYLRLADDADQDPAVITRPLAGTAAVPGPVPGPVTLLGVTPGSPALLGVPGGEETGDVAGGPDNGTD